MTKHRRSQARPARKLRIGRRAWLRLIALDSKLSKAEPKTLRYRILHAAGRLTRGARARQLRIPLSHTTNIAYR